MKRRTFFQYIALFTASNIFAYNSHNKNTTPWDTIETILNHFFPKYIYSYKKSSLTLMQFFTLIDNQNHYDNKTIEFLLYGANEFSLQYKDFKKYPHYKKEKILRSFEKTNLGENWLDLLMSIGLEALLSDPIYQGNTKQIAWTLFEHNYGQPRPQKRYIYGI